jgi:DNA ligase-1
VCCRPSTGEAAALLEQALAAGHEGVMVKALDAPYAAGRRGRAWQKVKPVHTLDLVVLGAEWGTAVGPGTLSNIHLGARDPDGGEPIMVGKTFKGMTDALLAWQTETFPRYAREHRRNEVLLRPSWWWRSSSTACSAHPYPAGRAAVRPGRPLPPTRRRGTPTRSTPCCLLPGGAVTI